MSNQLVPYQTAAPALSAADPVTLGKTLAQSGYFKDARDAAQAAVKVMYGAELGIGPISSMMGVYIIEGKPAYSANLMAAAVKRSGRYNYRIRRLDATGCEIEFFEGRESVGVSTFSIADAQAAGLAGKAIWKNYPRNLLFARAMSNGFRWYCPDLTGGAPAYTPEELGVAVDDEGTPLRAVTAVTEAPPRPKPAPPDDEPPQEPPPSGVADPDSITDWNRFWGEMGRWQLDWTGVHRYFGLAEKRGELKRYADELSLTVRGVYSRLCSLVAIEQKREREQAGEQQASPDDEEGWLSDPAADQPDADAAQWSEEFAPGKAPVAAGSVRDRGSH